jgi:hypothetical protein
VYRLVVRTRRVLKRRIGGQVNPDRGVRHIRVSFEANHERSDISASSENLPIILNLFSHSLRRNDVGELKRR